MLARKVIDALVSSQLFELGQLEGHSPENIEVVAFLSRLPRVSRKVDSLYRKAITRASLTASASEKKRLRRKMQQRRASF